MEEQSEWEEIWEDHHDRGKRRREWEEEGWEQWEVREETMRGVTAPNPTKASPGFPQEHLGGHAKGGGGAMTLKGEQMGAAKIKGSNVDVMGEEGGVCGGAQEGNNEDNEGVEGVGEGGVDVKGDEGKRKGVTRTGSSQSRGRIPLRGRRRGVKSAKAKEEEKMALYMEHWLVKTPSRD